MSDSPLYAQEAVTACQAWLLGMQIAGQCCCGLTAACSAAPAVCRTRAGLSAASRAAAASVLVGGGDLRGGQLVGLDELIGRAAQAALAFHRAALL